MKQAIAYTFDGVTSCQWLSDDEARIIQQNDISIGFIKREYDVSPVIVREHYEGGLLTIEFLPEPDPNAAMIARDGDAQSKKLHFVVDEALMLDCRPFTFWSSDGGVSFALQNTKPGVKPAITGLTTVHDGKVNGLGFCSDLGHE